MITRKERRLEDARASAVAFSNLVDEIRDEFGIDQRKEYLEYFKEKWRIK